MGSALVALAGPVLFAALGLIALYAIIRTAVCHGMTDALSRAGLAKSEQSDT